MALTYSSSAKIASALFCLLVTNGCALMEDMRRAEREREEFQRAISRFDRLLSNVTRVAEETASEASEVYRQARDLTRRHEEGQAELGRMRSETADMRSRVTAIVVALERAEAAAAAEATRLRGEVAERRQRVHNNVTGFMGRDKILALDAPFRTKLDQRDAMAGRRNKRIAEGKQLVNELERHATELERRLRSLAEMRKRAEAAESEARDIQQEASRIHERLRGALGRPTGVHTSTSRSNGVTPWDAKPSYRLYENHDVAYRKYPGKRSLTITTEGIRFDSILRLPLVPWSDITHINIKKKYAVVVSKKRKFKVEVEQIFFPSLVKALQRDFGVKFKGRKVR